MQNRFVVDLSGLDLSEAERNEINTRIQKVALDVLAQKKFKTPVGVQFPVEWLGIIINPDLKNIEDLEKKIGDTFKGGF